MKKIIILSLLVIIALLFATEIRRGFLAGLLLVDAVRPPEQAVMEKIFPAPAVEKLYVSSRGRRISADLYIPRRKGQLVPLLLVHDASTAGKADERIVSLAGNLARAGFLVLVPDIEALRSFRLRHSDAEDIVQCFRALIRQEPVRAGGCMLGFGFGAGPLLIAAADPRISGQIGTIAALGGSGDLRAVLQYGLTGSYEYGGHSGRQRPDQAVRWTLAFRNLDLFASSDERETMQRIMEKQFRLETGDVPRLARGLGPDGRAVYQFIRNTEPERFTPLYENLPTKLREYVHLMSPVRVAKSLKAEIILAHAEDDYQVPYTESQRIADVVGEPGRVTVAVLPEFYAGGSGLSAGDVYRKYVLGGTRLFEAIFRFLEKGRV
jgi:dienelactone hydrolase